MFALRMRWRLCKAPIPASIPESFGYTVFLYSFLHIKVKEARP
jgi:hypothetical protein